RSSLGSAVWIVLHSPGDPVGERLAVTGSLDIKARIDTARHEQWQGGVGQLEQALRHVDTKQEKLWGPERSGLAGRAPWLTTRSTSSQTQAGRALTSIPGSSGSRSALKR